MLYLVVSTTCSLLQNFIFNIEGTRIFSNFKMYLFFRKKILPVLVIERPVRGTFQK